MKKYNRNKNAFPEVNNVLASELRLREHFLNISLKGMEEAVSDEELKIAINEKKFYCIHGKHCMYCASKDICLEHGANTGGE
jgi:hypothetical protein